ncbi:MAG: glucosamine-6-phosphate deaminase [Hyphomicrobiales bacterium]|nr:MAG: glucosamine-6-phosphate deaminase [Hyphomicrobiales bacterium]
MKILITDSADSAAQKAASFMQQFVIDKPNAVLGLATGGTMLKVYHHMIEFFKAGDFSYANVQTFNLDEYVGLAGTHPASYRYYMNENLFQHIDINLANTHLPNGQSDDLPAEANRYEDAIHQAGGLDAILLGLGKNGHIGFNEPASSLASRTRLKTLAKSTREANMKYFKHIDDVPKYAITMGIRTILDTQNCILIATGKAKAQAVADMIEGPMSANCPASALQMHQYTTVILDKAAASKLKNLDYYHYVHPNGDEVYL